MKLKPMHQVHQPQTPASPSTSIPFGAVSQPQGAKKVQVNVGNKNRGGPGSPQQQLSRQASSKGSQPRQPVQVDGSGRVIEGAHRHELYELFPDEVDDGVEDEHMPSMHQAFQSALLPQRLVEGHHEAAIGHHEAALAYHLSAETESMGFV